MTKNPRGRPRAYDPEKALTRAMETFWAAGFTGTSLDGLAAATGMNRPSLYAAFGDKKAIYLKSLDLYAEHLREAMRGILLSDMPLGEALEAFYRGGIDLYLSGDEGPRGCFISCTAPAEAMVDEDIRAALGATLTEIDRGLERLYAKAKKRGEISEDADEAGLARLAGAVLHSIALRARAGEPRAGLEAIARQAAKTIR
ncbi:MAG: TetR/AcrR family transcriptional regulator [Alphaproteobacteria bacterium]|nr:TetR/AcrR family transcriptional regulator [Alphaproteobacteria bacterium]MDX5415089.1 TetR/AcrR family transcriptional regulator [Alphaproteobacteria bacterium]MDX5492280.1 TetR/AcrR family transcriptional regulator [Alphaproteobacteria bacterium]